MIKLHVGLCRRVCISVGISRRMAISAGWGDKRPHPSVILRSSPSQLIRPAILSPSRIGSAPPYTCSARIPLPPPPHTHRTTVRSANSAGRSADRWTPRFSTLATSGAKFLTLTSPRAALHAWLDVTKSPCNFCCSSGAQPGFL